MSRDATLAGRAGGPDAAGRSRITDAIEVVVGSRARHTAADELAVPVDVYNRGVDEGVFRPGLDIIDLHMTMSALAIFNISHRATFSRIFRRDMASPAALRSRCQVACSSSAAKVASGHDSATTSSARRRNWS